MTFKKLSICAVSALGASAFAMAFAGSPADYFEKIDADASGAVSKAEYVAYKSAKGEYSDAEISASFDKMAGEDGVLTLAEMEGAMKASKAKKDCKDKGQSA